jgi:predicted transcriptional regulator
VEKVKELYPLCFTMEPRWKIDGAKLREVRKILGVASKRFAEKCGWGESYQSKLEVGSVITVSDGHRKRMDEAIEFFLRQLF